MAVALAKLQAPITHNGELSRQFSTQNNTAYTSNRFISKLIANQKADFAKDVASKTSYEAALARSLEAKKFWDELLEKLRKSGGGGGSSNLDKIMTSMMFMNYLSNKMIQAMLNNFKLDFLKLLGKVTNLISPLAHNPFIQGIQRLSTFIFSGLVFASRGILKSITTFSRQLTALAGAVSFQLNKLKEILEEELKEIVRKLDVKSKMKKIKETLVDLFVKMKGEILSTMELLKSVVKIIFKLN